MATMRTTFAKNDPDHLQIHSQLATEYNRTQTDPWTGTGGGGGGAGSHLTADAFGLGNSTDPTTHAAALASFFAALPLSFTQSGLLTSGTGTLGEIPQGIWNVDQFGASVSSPSSAGFDVTITGQTAGGTTLTAIDRSPGTTNKWNGVKRGCGGTAAVLASATRGGTDATGYQSPSNVFTLQLTTPWWSSTPTRTNPVCKQFDPIYLPVMSCGVPRMAYFTCTMNNVGGDYTKVQYMGYSSGMAVDGCIPLPGIVYFPAALFHGLQFKGSSGHHLIVRNIAFQSGSNTGTPLDMIGVRRGSNMTVEPSVVISGFYDGETINGSPWPIAATGGVGQNTDHSKNKAKFLNNVNNASLLSNSAASWIQSLPVIGTGVDAGIAGSVGGGRDNNWDEANMGGPDKYHIEIADDGSVEAGNFDKVNFKSGYSVFHGQGVRGVQRKEPNWIDGIEGWFKTESQGNWIYDDESKTGVAWQFMNPRQRFESAIAINGVGSPTNFTDQPYFLQNCTMAVSPAVMTAKIVTTPGGSTGMTGHGIGPGDAIQIGNAGPNFTLDTSMIGLALPQAVIKVVEPVTAAPSGGGTFTVTASFGQITITYSGVDTGANTFTGCTGGAARNVLQHASGTNLQTGLPNVDIAVNVFNGETRVATIASDGCTITAPFPQYTGAAGGGTGTTATMGTCGFLRSGTFGRFDMSIDWALQGADRYTQAGMYFDVNTLSSGSIRMNRDYSSAAPRKKLPTFRVRDTETVKSTNGVLLASYTDVGGTVYTNVLQDVTVQFNATDVGSKIFCTGHLNGGGNSDTIATFIDVDHVAMTGTVTAGTALTWSMRITKVLDAFGVKIELGNRTYWVETHAGSVANPDANAIALGSLVEAAPTDIANLGVQCSTCSPLRRLVGVSMQPSNADASVSVSTLNTGTTALIYLNTPSPLVLVAPGAVNISDDVKLIGSAAITTAGYYLIDDGATNPGQVKQVAVTTGVPNTGQRLVGQSIATTSGAGAVAARVYPERWT